MPKPTTAELVGRIHTAAALLPAKYAAATSVAKTYEAYVWALTVEAAQSATGLPPTIVNTVSGSILLAGAPAAITAPYTYAAFPGTNLEVHAGVQVAGRSGVLHELDVSVLRGDACTRARLGARLCSHHANLAVEVKCYEGSLGPGIGRSVLGLNSDTYCKIRLVTNTRDTKARRMLIKRTTATRLLPLVRPTYPLVEAAAVAELAGLV
jgi:hypothetical protein